MQCPRLASLSWLLLLGGCAFNSNGVDPDLLADATVDIDAPEFVDASSDAAIDAAIADAGPPDAAIADAGPPDATPPCPLGYGNGGGVNATHCYRVVVQAKTWKQAENDCADDATNSSTPHLVVVDNEDEYNGIQTNLSGQLWVGANDNANEGTFVNVTGGAFDTPHWLLFQPDNTDGMANNPSNCVAVVIGSGLTGGFKDDGCNTTHAYLCEIDGVPPIP